MVAGIDIEKKAPGPPCNGNVVGLVELKEDDGIAEVAEEGAVVDEDDDGTVEILKLVLEDFLAIPPPKVGLASGLRLTPAPLLPWRLWVKNAGATSEAEEGEGEKEVESPCWYRWSSSGEYASIKGLPYEFPRIGEKPSLSEVGDKITLGSPRELSVTSREGIECEEESRCPKSDVESANGSVGSSSSSSSCFTA